MRFSMKTEYGVRAIFELAAHHGGEALQSAEIARRQRVPGPFLDQVLMTLRRAGLVRSMRGPHGGHLLSRLPSDIRLGEVISCLEGAGAVPDCLSHGDPCDQTYGCILHKVAEEADLAARNIFASHTLEDLLRGRGSQPQVYHGIFKPLPRRTRRPARV